MADKTIEVGQDIPILYQDQSDGTYAEVVVAKTVESTSTGAGATIGVTTGSAVVSDANGTLQGYLRGLVKIFADVWTSASHWLKVQVADALPAGTNNIGTAGIYAVGSVNFTHKTADTTQYTAKDAVGVNLTVSGATNATPIVVATGTHLLADGDYVTIAAVGGNTNANGNFYVKVTGQDSTHFALYTDKALTTAVAGNSEYTSGGTVARLFRLKDFFRIDGGAGIITKIRVITDSATFLDQLRIHFYSSPVTALLDNAVFTLLWANKDARLGYVDLPALATEGTGSDSAAALAVSGGNSPMMMLFVRNAETPVGKDLYFRIETLGTGTPASAQNFFVEVVADLY